MNKLKDKHSIKIIEISNMIVYQWTRKRGGFNAKNTLRKDCGQN